jgi:hypothetical protein
VTTSATTNLERSWARLGALLVARPAHATPDPERLLIETARRVAAHPRLFALVITWLVVHGRAVAVHRLAHLTVSELAESAPLGLILESAVALGGPRRLLVAAKSCRVRTPPAPLFASFARDPALTRIASETATSRSRAWGCWAPETPLKLDAVRPVAWMLERNPDLHDRLLRRGDLRCSVVETLRRDLNGRAASSAQLARLCGVTRAAARAAIESLIAEGEVLIVDDPGSRRDHPVVLRGAA